MELDLVKLAFLARPKPSVSYTLKSYSRVTETPYKSFTKEVTPSKESRNACLELLRERKLSKKKALVQRHNQVTKWVKKQQRIQEYLGNDTWVFKDEEPQCVSANEIELAEEGLYLYPKFEIDPFRFKKQKVKLTKLSHSSFSQTFKKVHNPKLQHENYKQVNVWTLDQIENFLREYFKRPKKFEDIAKNLDKSVKEIVQLFYLVKYPLRLKKKLRLQARRRREESLIEYHLEDCIQYIQDTLPEKYWLSQKDLAQLNQFQKIPEDNEYSKFYGKNRTSLTQSAKEFQDYCRYKEFCFGGHRVQDEGPVKTVKNTEEASEF